MSETDRSQSDRTPRRDGPLGQLDVEAVESVRVLIREERRLSLNARTLATTLESALQDYEKLPSAESDAQLIALRRQWCERVLDMLQEMRAGALRNGHAFALIAEQVSVGKSGTSRFAAARKQFERQADRAEETAMRTIGEVG